MKEEYSKECNKEYKGGKIVATGTPEEVSKMLNLPLEEIKKVQEQQMTVNK